MASSVLEILIKAKNLATAEFEKLEKSAKAAEAKIKSLNTESKRLGGLKLPNLGASLTKFKDGARAAIGDINTLGTRTVALGDKMQSVGGKFALAGAALGVPLAAGVASFARFEQSMNKVQAVSGATAKQMEGLSAIAKEMGSTTEFTASQAADALTFLAMAGLDANQSMEALPGTLQLATAGGIGLAESADIVTNVLAGLGLGVEDLGRVSDVLTATASQANTSVSEMGQAMKVAAPLAAATGVTVEEASAALGVLANNGIKGAEAGTKLRSMLIRLQKPTKEAQTALDSLGVSLTDKDDNFRGLTPILKDLRDAQLGVSDAAAIFGVQTSGAALAAVNYASDIEKLNGKLENAAGTTKRMADIMGKGLTKDLIALGSALEGLAIEVFEDMAGDMSGFVQGIRDSVLALKDWYTNLGPAGQALVQMGVKLVAFTAALGVLLIPLGAMISAFGAAGGGLIALGTRFAATKVGMATVTAFTNGLTAAFSRLAIVLLRVGTFLLANPIVALGVAIAATGVIVYDTVNAYNDMRKAQEKLAEQQKRTIALEGDAATKLKGLQEASDDVTRAFVDRIDAGKDAAKSGADLTDAQLESSKALLIAEGTLMAQTAQRILQDVEATNVQKQHAQAMVKSVEELPDKIQKIVDLQKARAVASQQAEAEAIAANQSEQRVLEDTVESIEAVTKARVKDVDEQGAQLLKLAKQSFDLNSQMLRDRQISDEAGALSYDTYSNNVQAIAKATKDKLLAIAEDEFRRKDALLGHASERTEEAQAEARALTLEHSNRMVEIARQEISTVSSLRDEAFSKYKSALAQVADLDRQIAQAQLQGEFDLTDLRRQGLNDFTSYEQAKSEAASLSSRIRRALEEGDFAVAQELNQRQRGLARSLTGEVKVGEKVYVTKEQAVRNAVNATSEAQKNNIAILKAKKQAAQEEANAQKALYEKLSSVLDRLAKQLSAISGIPDIDLNVNTQQAESNINRMESRARSVANGTFQATLNFDTKPAEQSLGNIQGKVDAYVGEGIEVPLTANQQQLQREFNAASDQIQLLNNSREVGVPLVADTREYVQTYEKVLSDDGRNKIRVGVYADDGLYQTRVQEIRDDKIVAVGEVMFPTTSLESAAREAAEILEGSLLDNSLRLPMQFQTDNAQAFAEINKMSIAAKQELAKESNSLVMQARLNGERVDIALRTYHDTTVEPTVRPFVDDREAQSRLNQLTRTENKVINVVIRETVQRARALGGLVSNISGLEKKVNGYATGGRVSGAGTGTSDSIMAKLSDGEFVIRAASVKKYGYQLMNALNRGLLNKAKLPAFATGGLVSANATRGATPLSGSSSDDNVAAVTALDLSFNGNKAGRLLGPRDTVETLTNALRHLQRGGA
jgi:TP901 family phage tail tape measure protein